MWSQGRVLRLVVGTLIAAGASVGLHAANRGSCSSIWGAGSSDLDKAARALAPGDFCRMPDNGFTYAVRLCGSQTDNYNEYGHGGAWVSAPGHRGIVYVGASHGGFADCGTCGGNIGGGCTAFLYYVDAENSWKERTATPQNLGTNAHGYDHTTYDPDHDRIWVYPMHAAGSSLYWKAEWADDGDGTIEPSDWRWTALSDMSDSCQDGFNTPTLGWDYDNTRNGIVTIEQDDSGAVCFRSDATGSWSVDTLLGPNLGVFNQSATYHPGLGVTWLVDQTGHWKNDNGNVTRMSSSPPFSLQCCTGSGGTFVAPAPGSDKFVTYNKAAQSWYEYDIRTDSWASFSSLGFTGPQLTGDGSEGIIVPIDTYGVVVLTDANGNAWYVYKHRSTAPPTEPPPPPGNVVVW